MSIRRFLWLVALGGILLAFAWKLQLIESFKEAWRGSVTAIPGLIVIKILLSSKVSGSAKFLLLFTAGAGFPAWVLFTFLFRALGVEPSWALAFLAAYPVALLVAEILERAFGYTFNPEEDTIL